MIDRAYLLGHVLPAALGLLPERMGGPLAEVNLLAIGWQESRLTHRWQLGRNVLSRAMHLRGPARGLWQFEKVGVGGVLTHRASAAAAAAVCAALNYQADVATVHGAVAHNDVLACAFARLLLWTHPDPLPRASEDAAAAAWDYYLALWRPGRPHPETWPEAHATALRLAGERPVVEAASKPV